MNTVPSTAASAAVSRETFPSNPLIDPRGSAEGTLSSASAVLALLSSQVHEGLDHEAAHGVFLTLRGVHEAVEFARKALAAAAQPARCLFTQGSLAINASEYRRPFHAHQDEWGNGVIRDAAGRAVAFMRGGSAQDVALAALIVAALDAADLEAMS
jgi:hypothetical protein